MNKHITEILIKYLNKNIAAILMYGSYADNSYTEDSDVDIAVVINNITEFDKKILFRIIAELGEKLNKKIDLVCFNISSPILKRQILKNNKTIYIGNDKKLKLEKMKALSQYADFKICRSEMEKRLVQ